MNDLQQEVYELNREIQNLKNEIEYLKQKLLENELRNCGYMTEGELHEQD